MAESQKNNQKEKGSDKIKIDMRKDEKRGIWTIMILYLVSWGLLWFPNFYMRFVAWLAMGLIGFTLWRVIDGLFERGDKK